MGDDSTTITTQDNLLLSKLNETLAILNDRKNNDTTVPYFIYFISLTSENKLNTLAISENDNIPITEDNYVLIENRPISPNINETISKTIEAHMSDGLKTVYSALAHASTGGSRKHRRRHKQKKNKNKNTKRRTRK